MAIYLQLYAKPFYIFFSHLKTIQSIFMKFSGDMGMVTLGSTLLSWGVHCYHGVNQNAVSMATYVMACPFMVYQHNLIWMAMHQISPYVRLPMVSIMTGGHTWPVNLLMPRDPGWTLMDMSFPTKIINGC